MAGVSSKEIKNRIRSMRSTRQITKAMKMVAASKLRRAQAQALASRPYFAALNETVQSIVDTDEVVSSPYLRRQQGGKVLYVVIAGDRGLAGGYNSNILKLCLATMEGKDAVVMPIGKKAAEFFRMKQIPLWQDNDLVAEGLSASHCFTLAKRLCSAYLSGEYSQIQIYYTKFVSVLSQIPVMLQALPLQRQEITERYSGSGQMIYEPDIATVFDAIIPEYLGGILYDALCESRAAEQAARRAAMDSATKNADDMIAELSLKYNQARQAAITQEITEIVAGS